MLPLQSCIGESTKFLDQFRPKMAEQLAGNTEQAMKSVLRINLNSDAIPGLTVLIKEATTAPAKQHDAIAERVRKLLQEHAVLKRFSDEELKMGNLTYRCPVWIEIDDVDFGILGNGGLRLDRRLESEQGIISHFAVRHYFNVPSMEKAKIGRAIGRGDSKGYSGCVAWIVSYDPTRDNHFRYRLDIECENLLDLSRTAIKIVACEEVANVSG